ncbi:MAG: choice-of-anchor L domain-containing protein, partial [Candidatus Limnocylindrales bacterium]
MFRNLLLAATAAILLTGSVPAFSLAAPTGLVVSDLEDGGALTVNSLAQSLVGSGVAIRNVVYTGSSLAAGTFTGGTGIIGFEAGV